METVLRKPEVYNYTNADHIEFHKLSYAICGKYAAVIADQGMLGTYNSKVLQEESLFKWIRKSDYTEKKAVTDHARDETYNEIIRMVRLFLKNPTRHENALHVYNLLENYGNLTHTGYDAETAAIDSIIARLRSDDYLSAVTMLGLLPWIDELETHNNLFKGYVNDAAQEQVDKPGIAPRQARRETDEALRRITSRVTSLINLNGPTAYADFAGEFNVLVNHYNTLIHEHYGRLHARIDITSANIASIPVQPYTGKPVYFVPILTLSKTAPDGTTTTTELVFSQDYTVSYRNNTGPGTATVIMKGIGHYVGELVTTFNIENVK
ncbi:MAG: DUF6261 family protein [Tannerella sp.]|jgi:hypothetical protein|nr:DUF6261 family protein [Tannerella sp.]